MLQIAWVRRKSRQTGLQKRAGFRLCRGAPQIATLPFALVPPRLTAVNAAAPAVVSSAGACRREWGDPFPPSARASRGSSGSSSLGGNKGPPATAAAAPRHGNIGEKGRRHRSGSALVLQTKLVPVRDTARDSRNVPQRPVCLLAGEHHMLNREKGTHFGEGAGAGERARRGRAKRARAITRDADFPSAHAHWAHPLASSARAAVAAPAAGSRSPFLATMG